jgi:hypothetical protein
MSGFMLMQVEGDAVRIAVTWRPVDTPDAF